jgi:hypothetical protein
MLFVCPYFSSDGGERPIGTVDGGRRTTLLVRRPPSTVRRPLFGFVSLQPVVGFDGFAVAAQAQEEIAG